MIVKNPPASDDHIFLHLRNNPQCLKKPETYLLGLVTDDESVAACASPWVENNISELEDNRALMRLIWGIAQNRFDCFNFTFVGDDFEVLREELVKVLDQSAPQSTAHVVIIDKDPLLLRGGRQGLSVDVTLSELRKTIVDGSRAYSYSHYMTLRKKRVSDLLGLVKHHFKSQESMLTTVLEQFVDLITYGRYDEANVAINSFLLHFMRTQEYRFLTKTIGNLFSDHGGEFFRRAEKRKVSENEKDFLLRNAIECYDNAASYCLYAGHDREQADAFFNLVLARKKYLENPDADDREVHRFSLLGEADIALGYFKLRNLELTQRLRDIIDHFSKTSDEDYLGRVSSFIAPVDRTGLGKFRFFRRSVKIDSPTICHDEVDSVLSRFKKFPERVKAIELIRCKIKLEAILSTLHEGDVSIKKRYFRILAEVYYALAMRTEDKGFIKDYVKKMYHYMNQIDWGQDEHKKELVLASARHMEGKALLRMKSKSAKSEAIQSLRTSYEIYQRHGYQDGIDDIVRYAPCVVQKAQNPALQPRAETFKI